MENDKTTIQGAQTVQRAVGLLKLVATNTKEGARLTDIADEMQLETPTVHRLLKALVSEGLLVKNDNTRRYRLGSLIFELGLASTNDFDIAKLSQPILQTLSLKTSDTSFLYLRNADEAVCIAREQGDYFIQTPVIPIGNRQPLGVNTGGLTLLCALPAGEMEKALKNVAPKLSRYGGTNINEVKALYNEFHDKGYTIIASPTTPGVIGVGVPLFNEHNKPIAAIAVSCTSSRMTEEHVQEILPHLKKAAQETTQLFKQKQK